MQLQIQILCRLLGIQLNLRQNYEKKKLQQQTRQAALFPLPLACYAEIHC